MSSPSPRSGVRGTLGSAFRRAGGISRAEIRRARRAQVAARVRASEQAAVARLGERALRGLAMDELYAEALSTLTRVLEAEYAGLMKLEPGGEFLTLIDQDGLDDGIVGARVPADERSMSGAALLSETPVTVEDWTAEDRFDLAPAFAKLGVRSGAAVTVRAREGSFGVVSVHSLRVRDFNPDELNFLQSMANVLAAAVGRSEAEAEIRHRAMHDPLTNLPNRTLFSDRLAQALAHARRHGTRVGVLFLDMDQFKLVNDSLGHDAGDELLRWVAPRLEDTMRAGDTVARFGGDEFGVIVSDLDTVRDATAVAERMSGALAKPFVVRGREHFVTATIGIAVGSGDEQPEALIRDADAAMYRAKERGRGRYEIFDDVLRARAIEQLRIENDLRVAAERGELTLDYQPVVSLASGRIVSVEALLRWCHPERGLLPPNDFIPLAEDTGLIVPIGGWVLHAACQQTAAWQREMPDAPPIGITVNLSARQFAERTLPQRVDRALRDADLDPACLSLEITESALMDEGAERTVHELKDLGVGLVLDDFGTGFSSLGYLKRFAFDTLKLDRSFIESLVSNRVDAAIVTAITGLAGALELAVVAEGVETEAQLERVRALGCQYAQGFYFTRPLAAEPMLELLEEELGQPLGHARLR